MKNKSISISVIIPVYNRKEILINCLKSIFNQSRFDLVKEIIIVDDHSNFSVRKYIEKKLENSIASKQTFLSKIKIIRNSRNFGPAYSRNIGRKMAKGEIIIYLDSDDTWLNRFIEFIYKRIIVRNGIFMTFTSPRFNKLSNKLLILRHLLLSLYRNSIMRFYSVFNHGVLPIEYFYICRLSSMTFNKHMLKNIKFDETYKSAEDWKYIYKVLSSNHANINIIPKRLSEYMVHDKSETLGRSGYFEYYRKLISEVSQKYKNRFGFKLFKIYADTSK